MYPANNEKIIEQTTEQVSDKENDEDKDGHPEVIKSTVQEIQTNSTILSKQIKIVTQLNAKQIDNLLSLPFHSLHVNMDESVCDLLQ